MSRDFTFKKRAIIASVTLLIAADVALAAYSWHLANFPGASSQQLNDETRKLKLFRADVTKAEESAANFPKSVRDCDNFEATLPQAASASSTISSELSGIAKKAGVQLTDIKYGDKQIEGRDITQRDIDADITGDYASFVKFLNALQKSPNYYVVESLDLGTEASAPNLIRIKIRMRTFYRSAIA